MTFGAPTAFIT